MNVVCHRLEAIVAVSQVDVAPHPAVHQEMGEVEKDLVRVLTARALRKALERARAN